jgi:hypothetical protein
LGFGCSGRDFLRIVGEIIHASQSPHSIEAP